MSVQSFSNVPNEATVHAAATVPNGSAVGSSPGFARMYVRLPLYVTQFLRTKYLSREDRAAPIPLPWQSHPAGRIIYARLVPNLHLKCLSRVCYSAQMFCIDPSDIPEELASLYPDPDARREFAAFALPKPHYYLGRFIDDGSVWQLPAEAATRFCELLLNELWSAIDEYWCDYKLNWSINHPDRVPVYYDMLLDFCEFYQIDVDSVDAMYRALKRRNKKLREKTPSPL